MGDADAGAKVLGVIIGAIFWGLLIGALWAAATFKKGRW